MNGQRTGIWTVANHDKWAERAHEERSALNNSSDSNKEKHRYEN